MAQIDSISKPEAIKQQSRQLRGHIARDLADTKAPFDKEGYALLKFHGVYQGYDRDSATELKQRGESKLWQFMVRVRIPGGRLTADQYLGLDEIAERWADGSLRITTRQSIQFHGVVKSGLKAAIAEVNHSLLTTLAACGDVVRTVTTVPAPIRDAVHDRLEADARRLSTHSVAADRRLSRNLGRRREMAGPGRGSRATRPALWRTLPAAQIQDRPRDPRGQHDRRVDQRSRDRRRFDEGDRLAGYDFLLGGGHGMTHNNPKTYPRLATPVAFVEPEDLLEAAAAVVRLHRDYGDRGNRRHARLKYVIAEHGEEWARERLVRISRQGARTCRPLPALSVPDHLGWHEQGDGKLYLGIPVASGRIADSAGAQTAHRVARDRRPLPLRPDPDAEPGHHPERDPAARIATRSPPFCARTACGLAEDMLPAERWALACPALPTCGLALTEAERVRDDIVAAIAAAARAHHGLERERLSIRITGCPNGCARPYTGDIGIVGRMPGYYALFVGGDFEGTRLNTPIADRVGARRHRRDPRPAVRALCRRSQRRRGFRRFLPPRRAAGAAAGAGAP